jgi:hypothetical protein
MAYLCDAAFTATTTQMLCGEGSCSSPARQCVPVQAAAYRHVLCWSLLIEATEAGTRHAKAALLRARVGVAHGAVLQSKQKVGIVAHAGCIHPATSPPGHIQHPTKRTCMPVHVLTASFKGCVGNSAELLPRHMHISTHTALHKE